MTQQDFRFTHRLRVRWAEVDMQKIVFNAHYLMYFDTAIADYWRALAMPYEDAMLLLEGDIYLKKATVEFNASARMDDRLDVAMKCARIGNSSMGFQGAIFRGDELLVTGELVYVFADPATQTSRPVPAMLREMLEGFEAGEPPVQVRTGAWAQLGADATRIRTEVFVQEQRIPKDLEWDEADATALHAVAYNRLGQAVGTGRLLPSEAGSARIGRMAVHRVLRGCRLGEQLLETLMAAARARGDREVLLHAQRSAQSFYARLGFQPRGEVFEEAGIAHVEMTRALG
ncbi:YbgC/FadM family acyl-CoA thioesterase [Caenimonas terrae]|uniref:YbgC/FadM family acyl-CoA thioesterase n=1 Tax=Caenimonas terrae TaxID=696074 RepID=A0ABW0NHW1_9BURK